MKEFYLPDHWPDIQRKGLLEIEDSEEMDFGAPLRLPIFKILKCLFLFCYPNLIFLFFPGKKRHRSRIKSNALAGRYIEKVI